MGDLLSAVVRDLMTNMEVLVGLSASLTNFLKSLLHTFLTRYTIVHGGG